MDKIELLVDHFKDTNEVVAKARAQRDRYFRFLCLFELCNLLFMLHPSEIINCLVSWVDEKYGIILPPMVNVLQVALWLVITYTLVLYVQRSIYIEREYIYLKKLEQEIQTESKVRAFSREGESYLNDYPSVLSVIDVFYKWAIPLIILIVNVIKIIFETIGFSSVLVLICDCSLFLFTICVDVLYFYHVAIKKRN